MSQEIKVKIGNINIEYIGNEEYIKNEFILLLDKLLPYSKNELETNSQLDLQHKTTESDTITSNSIEMSVNSISGKIGVNSGPDMVIAASAYLALVEEKETFNRKEILEKMKDASNYYKKSYTGNLTIHLKNLVNSGKIIERRNDVYAFSAAELSSLRNRLNG